MNRIVILIAMVAVAAAVLGSQAVSAPAPRTNPGQDWFNNQVQLNQQSQPNQTTYVLVQVCGDDVNCSVFTTTSDVKKQQDLVAQKNAETMKANSALAEDIQKLKAQLAQKQKALAKANGGDGKAAIQKEIDDLKARIEQKQGELEPLIQLFEPRKFNNQADAEKFIENTVKEAEQIKLKKAEDAARKGAK